MTPKEYRFLTDQWDPLDEDYDQTRGFCKAFRWTYGFDRDGIPILTDLGKHEIKKFEQGDEEEAESA